MQKFVKKIGEHKDEKRGTRLCKLQDYAKYGIYLNNKVFKF